MRKIEELKNFSDVKVELDKDLSKYSTMRLKAQGDLITISSTEAIIKVQKFLNQNKIPSVILGMGANTLLPEHSKWPYLQLNLPFDSSYLDESRDTYTLPASVRLSKLSSHASKFGLKGWDAFTGIPATLGGAVFMNAGTNLGEIGSLVKRVRVITGLGDKKVIEINKDSFSYRKNNFLEDDDLIYEIEMIHLGLSSEITQKIKEYLALRNRSQPLKEWTCGCTFKNSSGKQTCRAGKFIDILGLKGFTHKNIRISPKHANFMENTGNATKAEMLEAIEIVKNELKLQFGVEFEAEVRI